MDEAADSIFTTAEVIAMSIKATSGNLITFDEDESAFLEFAFNYFSENPEVMYALQLLVDGVAKGEIAPVNIQ